MEKNGKNTEKKWKINNGKGVFYGNYRESFRYDREKSF